MEIVKSKFDIGRERLSFEETKKEVEALSIQYGDGCDIELLPHSEEEHKIRMAVDGRVFEGCLPAVSLIDFHFYPAAISRTLHKHKCKDKKGLLYC